MTASFENSRAPEQVSASPANDRFAAALRRFGLLGIFSMVLILAGNELFVPLSAILVLVWVRLSRTPWREIGYVRPRTWIGSIFIGITLGVALKFAMKAIVMPLLDAPEINPAYHFLAGNTAELPRMLYIIILGAGFGEETVFRGWMFERFGKLFGQSTVAKVVIVLITSIWFGLAHYSFQGLPGVEQALIVGLVFGSIFAVTGRVFTLIIAHAAFDLTALAMIYWDFETSVAHFIFD
jgi:membrane protease YdiL (CAAX protease family)